jgi:hypothetical protein
LEIFIPNNCNSFNSIIFEEIKQDRMKSIFFFTSLLALAACKPIETNPDILTDNSKFEEEEFILNPDGNDIETKTYRATETLLTDLMNTD